MAIKKKIKKLFRRKKKAYSEDMTVRDAINLCDIQEDCFKCPILEICNKKFKEIK